MCEIRKSMESRSSNSMKRGINLELIPTDVIMEIFSRLPSKSIARFRSVSKLWDSMLGSPYFTELFNTRSRSRPRLLFVVEGESHYEWLSYSLPQPQNTYEKSSSSLVVAADYHAEFSGLMELENFFSHAFGLVYFPHFSCTPPNHQDKLPMICNPITGQYVTLPKLDDSNRKWTSFLGFDPIDKQFKVLAEAQSFCSNSVNHKILTLGTGTLTWRNSLHSPRYRYMRCFDQDICIDGVLYYLAKKGDDDDDCVIVCFDVRFEKFKLMDVECHYGKLVNYKGKLAGILLEVISCNNTEYELSMSMWVLEDVEKQEWSKSVYTYKSIPSSIDVAGVTATGEIVLAMYFSYKPFCVFYFNPERKTLQRIEIQGFQVFGKVKIVHTFVDYAEELSQSSLLHMHLKR